MPSVLELGDEDVHLLGCALVFQGWGHRVNTLLVLCEDSGHRLRSALVLPG